MRAPIFKTIGQIIFPLGVICAVLLSLFLIFLNHRILDGIIWRFETFESKPTLSQRIFERLTHRENIWQNEYVPSDSVLMFGDSHLQLIARSYLPHAYNFSVSGQGVGRMIERVPLFSAMSRASLIVINGGENDLSEGANAALVGLYWQKLFTKLPPKLPILCVGLPVSIGNRLNENQVRAANIAIKNVCEKYGADFLDLDLTKGPLKGQQMSNDRMHLSASGTKALAVEIDRRYKSKIQH